MKISEQSKKSLMKVLDKSAEIIGEALDASGKLVKDNAKELVTEVIVYHGYVNNAFSLVGSLIAALFLNFGFNWVSTQSKLEDGLRDGRYVCYGALFVASFLVVIWFLCSLQEILKAKFAPRLYLIDYAVSLVKSDDSKEKKS